MNPLAALLILFGLGGPLFPAQTPQRRLVVCGWDEVFVLDLAGTDTGRRPEKTWSWRAKEAAGLPAAVAPLFNATDECKPVDSGRKVLITSSGGAVALVDRTDNRVLFYGRAANAHSAELLPEGRVAVAASHDPAGRGDRLVVFDLARADLPLFSEELSWGHGVVWDDTRQALWALADRDLRVYRLRDWVSASPRLEREEVVLLPEAGGHDLAPVPGGRMLSVTTANRCWLFDRETRRFQPHPDLADQARVKGISQHPRGGELAYVQAEGNNWWAERIRLLNPPQVVHLPGERLYKARWLE